MREWDCQRCRGNYSARNTDRRSKVRNCGRHASAPRSRTAMRQRRRISWAIQAPIEFSWQRSRLLRNDDLNPERSSRSHRDFLTKRRCWKYLASCPPGSIVHHYYWLKGKQYWHRWELVSPGKLVALGCEPTPVSDDEAVARAEMIREGLERLRWSVQALAAPADSQLSLGLCGGDLDYAFEKSFRNIRLRNYEFEPEVRTALKRLRDWLRSMYAEGDPSMWSDAHLRSGSHWVRVRDLAAEVLVVAGWPAELPSLPSLETD